MIKIDKLSLKLLKINKISISRMFEKVQKQMDELSEEIKKSEQYKDFVKNKYCIVCANRDYKNDFSIQENPEKIVCTHPCNCNEKDKFKYYTNTCENWKKDKFKLKTDK